MTLPSRNFGPVTMTLEEFLPPHKEGTTFGESYMAALAMNIRPVGRGKPWPEKPHLHARRYRLHEGRYSLDFETNERAIARQDFALVATFDGDPVGVINGGFLWVHGSQRLSLHRGFSVDPFDLAAELWAERAMRKGYRQSYNRYANNGKPIPLTAASLKVAKRAYALLVARGCIVNPEAANG